MPSDHPSVNLLPAGRPAEQQDPRGRRGVDGGVVLGGGHHGAASGRQQVRVLGGARRVQPRAHHRHLPQEVRLFREEICGVISF